MSYKIDSQSEPNVVYHYTSMDTFLKIVQTKQLWATNVTYLNDTTEQEHFFRRAVDRLPHAVHRFPKWRDRDLSAIGIYDPQELVAIPTSPFITSFSGEDDSLPQWRAYCPDGNGVSIGFRVANLKQAKLHLGDQKDPFGIDHALKWGRVEYDCEDSAVDEQLADLINQASEHVDEEKLLGTPAEVLRSYIRSRAVFYKHPSFQAEHEYRLVLPGTYWLRYVIHYTATKSTLRPHVKIDVPPIGATQEDHDLESTWNAIASIRIGPTPNPKLTAASVHTMLYDQRINCHVRTSEVPYRDW